MPRSSPRQLLIVTALGAAVLAGCGSDTPAAKSTEAVIVNVKLKEWSFEASQTSAAAGAVTFQATNDGKEVHELVLFKSDLAPEALPVDQDGAVDEQGQGLEFIDEVEGVKPGATKAFTATLKPGKYVMACNVIENGEKHFMRKMFARFTVTA